MIEKKINKKITLANKRKISSIPEFTPDMGALSESDVVYYLSDLQNTILKLPKLYLGKEYLNVNTTANKFLKTINVTYLEKLKLSFDIKIEKFSTILTENSIEQLKNIILTQFYAIENYVHESSNLVRDKVNYFLYVLNNSSEFIESLSGYIHNQALGYYNILYSTIQSKYINLENKILPIYDFDGELKIISETKVTVLEMVKTFKSKFKLNFNLTHILKDCLCSTTLGKIMKKMDDISKIQKSFKETIAIMFPPVPNLQIRITPEFFIGLGFYASIEPNWEQLKFNLAFEVYAEAYFSIKLEGGIYVPCSPKSPIQTAFAVGLDGVIAHARVGMRLEIYLNEFDITIDLYFIGEAFKFEFYFQARVEIKIPLFESEYSYDIFRQTLFGYKTEYHISNKAKKKSDNSKNFALTFGNPGHND